MIFAIGGPATYLILNFKSVIGELRAHVLQVTLTGTTYRNLLWKDADESLRRVFIQISIVFG